MNNSQSADVLGNLSKELLKSYKNLNSTHLLISDRVYRYAVLKIRPKNTFIPETIFNTRISLSNNIIIAYRPWNMTESGTPTGGYPYPFTINYGGKECNLTIWEIGFMINSFKAYISLGPLCGGKLYLLILYKGLDEGAWLILQPA